MKTKKNYFKWLALAAIATLAGQEASAQTTIGEDCGCPPISQRTAVLMTSIPGYLDVTGTYGGELTNGATLTCDKIYTLNKKIYIPTGKTLTIQPGTVIKALDITTGPESATALVIEKGGKIMAEGTKECPIVFTANADPLNGTYPIYNSGKWGGIVILGKAKNNLTLSPNGPFLAGSGNKKICVSDGIGVVEGFATSNIQDQFGMGPGNTDDNDNSGVMRYVSIRHSGAILAVGSEINGLTLASVGRGTTIENIEIVSCADDAVEVFGGTVNLKRISQIFGNDDMFDYDLGWTGKAQFLFGMKSPWSASQASANVTATVAGGAVTALTCNPCGTGYTTVPTLVITGGTPTSGNTITPATATCTISSGGLAIFTISGGANYATAPTVTVVGGGLGTASPDNDNGFEADSDDDKSNNLPKSHPVIYNATIIGNMKTAGSSDNTGLAAINMKEDAEGEIYNSIFANFKNGLNVETATNTNWTNGNTYQNWTNAGTYTATASGASAGTTLTLSAANANIVANMWVTGSGIAPNTKITSISGLDLTLSQVSTAAMSGTYSFGLGTTTTPFSGNGSMAIKVKCNTFVGVTNPITVASSNINGSGSIHSAANTTQFTTTDLNDVPATLPGFNATGLAFNAVASSNVINVKNDVIPFPQVPVGAGCSAAPLDGFFVPVSYRGAFKSQEENWLSDWSFSALLKDIKGMESCPTDLNGDGITDVADFQIFAPAFGLSCN